MLDSLTLERKSIKEAMAFALDHTEQSSHVVELLTESLVPQDIPLPLKIARLYLVSDILYNSSARVPNASSYRRCFESTLPHIFESLNETHKNISGRITAQNLKEQILKVIRIWEGWSLYPQSSTATLHHIFLLRNSKEQEPTQESEMAEDEDLDGVPI